MDRLAIVRSVHHDAAPIHETGHQLLQTGRLCRTGEEHPHIGSVVTRLTGAKSSLPPFAVLPGPISKMGVDIPHGQSAGWLGPVYDPFHLGADPAGQDYDPRSALKRARRFLDDRMKQEMFSRPTRAQANEGPSCGANRNAFNLSQEREEVREAYGRTTFGQSCLLAHGWSRPASGWSRSTCSRRSSTASPGTATGRPRSARWTITPGAAADLRPGLRRPDRRPGAARSAGIDAGGRRRRVRPHAPAQRGRRPRPLAGRLERCPGRRRRPRRAGRWAPATLHAGSPVDRPVTPQDLLATMYHSLGIDAAQYLIRPDGESPRAGRGCGTDRGIVLRIRVRHVGCYDFVHNAVKTMLASFPASPRRGLALPPACSPARR